LKVILLIILFVFSYGSLASLIAPDLEQLRIKIKQSPEVTINTIERLISSNSISENQTLELKIIMADGYLSLGNSKKSLDIINTLIIKARELGFDQLEVKALKKLAVLQEKQADFKTALLTLKLRHIIINKINDPKQLGNSFKDIGNLYSELGEYLLSLEAYHSSLKLLRKFNDEVGILILNQRIAWVYKALGDYSGAVKYHLYAIEMAERLNNDEFAAAEYSNLAHTYKVLGKTKLSHQSTEESANYKNTTPGIALTIERYLAKASQKYRQGKRDDAQVFFDKALEVGKASGKPGQLIQALLGIAKGMHPSETSREFAHEALKLARKENSSYNMQKANKFLIDVYSELKDFESAEKYKSRYHELRSPYISQSKNAKSIIKEYKQDINKFDTEIELELEKHRYDLLEKDIELKEFKSKSSLVGIAILLLTFFALYRRHFHKKHAKQLSILAKDQAHQISALSEIGRKITSTLDINKVSEVVYEHAHTLLGTDSFAIGIYKYKKQQISFVFAIKDQNVISPYKINMTDTESLAVLCIKNGHEIIDEDFKADITKKGSPDNLNGTIDAYLPLFVESKIIGCMLVQQRNDDNFSYAHLNIMRTIASYTAVAIDNALTHEALKLASHTDFLTELPNRRSFIEKAELQLKVCKRNETPLCFAISDIDKFKLFNDMYGHDGGDFVLKKVSKLFENQIREQDIVARWGGEEFVFMFPNTDLIGAINILEKLRLELEMSHYEFDSQTLNVTSTFGVTIVEDNLNLDYIIDIADSALYEGKKSGRNKVVYKRYGVSSINSVSP